MDPELFTLLQPKIRIIPREETRWAMPGSRHLQEPKSRKSTRSCPSNKLCGMNLAEEHPLTRRGNRQEMLRPRLLSTWLAKERVRKMMLSLQSDEDGRSFLEVISKKERQRKAKVAEKEGDEEDALPPAPPECTLANPQDIGCYPRFRLKTWRQQSTICIQWQSMRPPQLWTREEKQTCPRPGCSGNSCTLSWVKAQGGLGAAGFLRRKKGKDRRVRWHTFLFSGVKIKEAQYLYSLPKRPKLGSLLANHIDKGSLQKTHWRSSISGREVWWLGSG